MTADDGRRTLEAAVPEKVFQKQVEAYLKLRGFLVYHTYDSRRSAGGFPDIVAVHAEKRRLLFLELKRVKGKTTPAQDAWLIALEEFMAVNRHAQYSDDVRVHVRVLRPTQADWAWLEAVCA